jgi:hypothetical protein
MKEIRNKARELMKGSCRVCPVCDGRACAGEVPGMGGLGRGTAFKNNVGALAGVSLNMRLIHDVREPSTARSWLGIDLALPVVASPIGGMFNFNDAVAEDEYIRAVINGSNTAGIIACTGDGVPPIITDSAFAGISAAGGRGIPFIKPWESDELDEKMERAFAAACPAVGMDIDAAGLITLRKMGRPVGPKNPKELAAIVEKAHRAGCRFILKGVMTVDDARRALDAGVDCIAVSNHGGRVLECVPGTADVLPAISEAVGGRISIMADGGVRGGADVLKMLALGADVAGIGRPVAIAAVGGGSAGVATYIEQVKNELAQNMILTGCADIASISGDILYRRKEA